MSAKTNCTHRIAAAACPEIHLHEWINAWQRSFGFPSEGKHLISLAFAALVLSSQWWSFGDTGSPLKSGVVSALGSATRDSSFLAVTVLIPDTWFWMVAMQTSEPSCLISDTGALLGKLLVPDLPDYSYLIYGDVPHCGMFTTESKLKTASTAEPKNWRILLCSADTVDETWC